MSILQCEVLSVTLISHTWHKKETVVVSLRLNSHPKNSGSLYYRKMIIEFICSTLTYSGSFTVSTRRLTLSSHTGLRFLWMVLLLNTSFPAILNFTYGSLVPTRKEQGQRVSDQEEQFLTIFEEKFWI